MRRTNPSKALYETAAATQKEVERLQFELAKWVSHNGEMERAAAEYLKGKRYARLSYEGQQLALELMQRNRIKNDRGTLVRIL